MMKHGLWMMLVWMLWPWHVRAGEVDTTYYSIHIIHPAMSKTELQPCTLVRLADRQNEKVNYQMDVASVICEDKKCSVVNVRLWWDDLGYYQRYQLDSGVRLEKFDGKPFTAEDYQKLDEVLADTGSFLKDLDIEKRFDLSAEDHNADAVSGASFNLNKNLYVQGALWTCYTLWHWANGDIKKAVQHITEQEASSDNILAYLKSGDARHQQFALEHYIKTKCYTPAVMQAVIDNALHNEYSIQKETLNYLICGGSEIYFEGLKNLMHLEDMKLRKLCLKSMNDVTWSLPNDFAAEVCSVVVVKQPDYPEVDMLLNLLEHENIDRPALHKILLPLLQNTNSLIARRTYWYLSECDLTKNQLLQLRRYYKQNKEFLE